MKIFLACILLYGLASGAPVWGAIHVGRDAASGALIYSNMPAGSRGGMVRDVATKAAPPAPAPDGFPVIARADQQRRDHDRKAILNDELIEEQRRLELARANGAAPEVQHRHRSNIEALLREITAGR